ncbi:PIF1-like helicase-domain-containing protein [Suillus discolor]|uniref:ATP-dependent DNA helicase n=1 Tax=Suillus discolor TaxID=1912936 RepID=A0A9P7F809_9AGAM|nr:PIF1-like helicase-domain-containing protein [Suillus discolor]KAG2108046.1 PIF1-like helicase-domain-containing protein [Suillus discolor]
MATSASFHGVVGLQNGSRYQIDRKNFWRYDGFIATPELGDIRVNVQCSHAHSVRTLPQLKTASIYWIVDLHSSIHLHLPRADLIRNASAIIWDELPAINRAAWKSVDELCRITCNRPRIPFGLGGKTFIGLGDCRQADPVVSRAGETATLAASVKSSTLWQNIRILNLNTPMRSMGDTRLTAFVDRVGEDCSGNRQSRAHSCNHKL